MTTRKKSLDLSMDVILDSIADGIFTIDNEKMLHLLIKQRRRLRVSIRMFPLHLSRDGMWS